MSPYQKLDQRTHVLRRPGMYIGSVDRQTADLWVWFGLGAQSIFFARWLVQWIASERKGESTIPVAFWWCSIVGGVGLFVYAWRNVDLPIMLAQAAGILMYSRNLYLIYRPKAAQPPKV